MHIRVRLLGSYRSLLGEEGGPPGVATVAVAAGASVAELLAQLPIPAESVPTAFVNGRHAELGQELEEGDEVSVFAAVGGG